MTDQVADFNYATDITPGRIEKVDGDICAAVMNARRAVTAEDAKFEIPDTLMSIVVEDVEKILAGLNLNETAYLVHLGRVDWLRTAGTIAKAEMRGLVCQGLDVPMEIHLRIMAGDITRTLDYTNFFCNQYKRSLAVMKPTDIAALVTTIKIRCIRSRAGALSGIEKPGKDGDPGDPFGVSGIA
jgi:hypothetical protein